MEIAFEVGGQRVLFSRSPLTGRAELQVGDEVALLQSPHRLTTHFDLRTHAVWQRQVGAHDVAITRRRARFFGGMRRSSYTVAVDGAVVLETTG